MNGLRGLSLAAITIAIAACSSNSSNGSNNGNNTKDGSTGTTADGAPASDGATGASTPQACEASITYRQRCAETAEAKSDNCANGRRQTCDKLLATMAPAYAAAYADCTTPSVSCDEGPDACIAAKLAPTTGSPTAAQVALRDHYCATCPSATCTADFYKIDADNGNGPGYTAFIASDAVVQMIDQKCTGASLAPVIADAGGDCAAAYGQCQSDTAGSALPDDPDTCYPPYTGDDTGDGG